MSGTSFETLFDRLDHTLATRPDTPFLTVVDGKGRDEITLSFAEIDRQASKVAGWLLNAKGLSRGDRVLLVYPPGAAFAVAMVACLYAELVPVPLAPPNPMKPTDGMTLFQSLCADCTPSAILSETRYIRARRLGAAKHWITSWSAAGWPDLPWFDTARPGRAAPHPRPRTVDGDVPVVLQYTSGSTSRPKGVILTHRNLWHQATNFADVARMSKDMVTVGWVPHFHDYYLISMFSLALWFGSRMVALSALDFVRSPRIWFDVIDRVRATHTAAPNFAYDIAVAKTTPAIRAGWDLSCLQVCMSAAEPILPRTVRTFRAAFAEAGLPKRAWCASYGLAEHTVGATTWGQTMIQVDRRTLELERRVVLSPTGTDAATQTLVCCGSTDMGVAVKIVDPDTRRDLGECQVGEIWLDSGSKGAGYWGNPEATAATFHATTVPPGDRTWLRTGDLGTLVDGQLYVTGRLKEMIITRGRNLYPHDLEESLRALPGVRPGGVIVFPTVVEQTEAFGFLVEIEPGFEPEQIVDTALVALQSEHRASPSDALVGKPRSVPKTTSGKLRRGTLAQLWRRSDADLLGEIRYHRSLRATAHDTRTSGSRLEDLQSLIAEFGNIERPPADARLDALGLDSLELVEVASALQTAGYDTSIADLLTATTVRQLADRVPEEATQNPTSTAASAFQRELLRDSTQWPGCHQIVFGLCIGGDLNVAEVQHILDGLVERHPLLGQCFRTGEGGEVHRARAAHPTVSVQRVADDDALHQAWSASASTPFDLAAGPLVAVRLFQQTPGRTVLQLGLHHLVYDASSMLGVLAELVHALRGDLPERPDSEQPEDYGRFVAWESQVASGASSRAYWSRQLAGALPTLPSALSQREHASLEQVEWPADTGPMVDTLVDQHGGTAFSHLLCAFQLGLARHFEQQDVLVGTTISLRSQPDFRHLVGPVVHYAALRMSTAQHRTLSDAFEASARAVRWAMAHSDLPLSEQLACASLSPERSGIGLAANFNYYPLHDFGTAGHLAGRLRAGEDVGREGRSIHELNLPVTPAPPRPYGLMLTLSEAGHGPRGALRFHPGVLDAAAAAQVVEHAVDALRTASTDDGILAHWTGSTSR